MITFDEGQQLDEDNVFYALSRLRSTRTDYPLQAMMTCNPDPDTYLFQFVKHSLDENFIPIRREDYPERYFVRTGSSLSFYDSREEADVAHPADDMGESPVKGYKFIPGSIYDNPLGLLSNKSYISTLKALPPIESRRLLDGAWVSPSASGFFKRAWVSEVTTPNTEAKRRCRSWDMAFSEVSEARPNVDATAGVLLSRTQDGIVTVEDVVTLRKRVHEVEQKIFETAALDGTGTIITLPLDPGATGGAYCRDLARRLIERGFTVKLIRPEKSKMQRFMPFAALAEAGFVRVVKSDWTEAFYKELETLDFTNKTHDDQADCCSDAVYTLCKQQDLPTLSYSMTPSYSNTLNLTGSLGSTGLNAPPIPTSLPRLNF